MFSIKGKAQFWCVFLYEMEADRFRVRHTVQCISEIGMHKLCTQIMFFIQHLWLIFNQLKKDFLKSCNYVIYIFMVIFWNFVSLFANKVTD